MRKKRNKYNYDIKEIERLRNTPDPEKKNTRGYSERKTARILEYNESNMNTWLANNFIQTINYKPRKKK